VISRPTRTTICVLIAAFGIFGCGKEDSCRSRALTTSGEETPRPAIRLLGLDDEPVDIWMADRPAIMVVLFTRSDCPISNRCAPEIRRLYDTYHPRGVEFYLVYVDPREQPEAIRQHLREYEYPCRALRDPEHTLVAHCGATTTPEAVVFDRDRTITYRGRVDDLYADVGRPRDGPTTHDLADAIEATVLGRPVATPRTQAVGCPIADLKP